MQIVASAGRTARKDRFLLKVRPNERGRRWTEQTVTCVRNMVQETLWRVGCAGIERRIRKRSHREIAVDAEPQEKSSHRRNERSCGTAKIEEEDEANGNKRDDAGYMVAQ